MNSASRPGIPASPNPQKAYTFNKQRPWLDRRDTTDCLGELFAFYGPERLPLVLQRWLLLALGSEAESPYSNGADRARLLLFVSEMQQLIPALYHIQQGAPEPGEDDYRLSAFCHTFPRRHSRAELWQLLDAVVSYEGPIAVERGNLLRDFEALCCLAEAAYSYAGRETAVSSFSLPSAAL